jgi:hypothetical protein
MSRKWLIGLSLLGLVAASLVVTRAWPELFFPLPFTGPRNGRVLDAATGQAIAGATILAEWWCHDNPLPDGPGHYTIRTEVKSDQNGVFKLNPPARRRGWFGTSFTLQVSAREYIDAVLIVDPENTPLPPQTAAWPFAETSIHQALPETLTIQLQAAKPVIQNALSSPDPLIRQAAQEKLKSLEGP